MDLLLDKRTNRTCPFTPESPYLSHSCTLFSRKSFACQSYAFRGGGGVSSIFQLLHSQTIRHSLRKTSASKGMTSQRSLVLHVATRGTGATVLQAHSGPQVRQVWMEKSAACSYLWLRRWAGRDLVEGQRATNRPARGFDTGKVMPNRCQEEFIATPKWGCKG